MIIVKLQGGLGNQMFQYAAGRSLSARRNTPLKFDLSFLRADAKGQYTQRHFELDVFNTRVEEASAAEVARFLQKGKVKRLLESKIPALITHHAIYERGFAFQEGFFDYPSNAYLTGFWQSERYFQNIRAELLREFSPRRPLNAANAAMAQRIEGVEAVSVHIRRGDYVSNAHTNAYHGICSPAYYTQALAYLRERVPGMQVFVFTDDAHWAHTEFKPGLPFTVIDYNHGADSYNDLYLMSRCKHQVIANSSFSWWGAWLNANAHKTVIAPKQWFADTSINTSDLLPGSWIRL